MTPSPSTAPQLSFHGHTAEMVGASYDTGLVSIIDHCALHDGSMVSTSPASIEIYHPCDHNLDPRVCRHHAAPSAVDLYDDIHQMLITTAADMGCTPDEASAFADHYARMSMITRSPTSALSSVWVEWNYRLKTST